MLGHWDNYEEMEDKLTLQELYAVADAAREQKFREMKFLAALKGIDLEDDSDDERRLQEMKYEAQARAEGVTTDEVKFRDYGIQVISELE